MSTYLRVLRHRDFRYLFLGQSASAVGDQVVIVALALYITQRTGSPSDLGLVLAAQSVPLVALILFGGVWADRLPRHRIMVVTDLVRAALHAVLAALILTGGATVAEMVVLEALFGAARAFFQPAYTGLMPQTISEDLNQDARALSETTANLAILVGPALGAALVLGIGAGEAFVFDALTFVVSALLLMRVRPRPRGSRRAPRREPILHELRAGFGEVRSRPWVWVTIAAFAGAVLSCYAQYYALAPTIARDVYGSAGLFGLFESVAGAGAVTGALIGIRWRPRHPMVAGLLLCLAWPLQALCFALGAPLAGVIALSFAAGFGFSLFGVWWETALARHIPPHALSRVSAYDWMGSLALLPLGFVAAGPLAAALGERAVLGVGSVIAFLLLALALLPRSTRSLGGGRGPAPSGQQLARDVGVELGREPEVADVDPLVGVVHERSRL
ncbi:MAG TPA: MFS transporter [Solirubrobacteraceae bacterium]|jgi:predicted MFS family arabinose efflux permease